MISELVAIGQALGPLLPTFVDLGRKLLEGDVRGANLQQAKLVMMLRERSVREAVRRGHEALQASREAPTRPANPRPPPLPMPDTKSST